MKNNLHRSFFGGLIIFVIIVLPSRAWGGVGPFGTGQDTGAVATFSESGPLYIGFNAVGKSCPQLCASKSTYVACMQNDNDSDYHCVCADNVPDLTAAAGSVPDAAAVKAECSNGGAKTSYFAAREITCSQQCQSQNKNYWCLHVTGQEGTATKCDCFDKPTAQRADALDEAKAAAGCTVDLLSQRLAFSEAVNANRNENLDQQQIPPAFTPQDLPLTCRQRLYIQSKTGAVAPTSCTLEKGIAGTTDANGNCTKDGGCACKTSSSSSVVCTVPKGSATCQPTKSDLGKAVPDPTIDAGLRDLTLVQLNAATKDETGFLWRGNFHALCLKCGECSVDDFLQVLVNFIVFAMIGVGGIALFWFIYGAFVLTISRGNPEGVEKGKGIMVNTVLGLLLSLSAWMIVNFTIYAISGGKTTIFTSQWFQVQLSQDAAKSQNQTDNPAAK